MDSQLTKHFEQKRQWNISEYVSEYTSEYINECTSECASDYVRRYINEYVSEYTSEYISKCVSEKTAAPTAATAKQEPTKGAARFSAQPPVVGAAARGHRTYSAVAALGAAAFFTDVLTGVFTGVLCHNTVRRSGALWSRAGLVRHPHAD